MRTFIITLRKFVTSYGFLICVGMAVMLLFSSEVYYDYDTQTRYSVFRTLMDFTFEERCARFELCSSSILKSAQGTWFTLFAPIIAAFCFVPTICTEREEKAARFQIFRTTRLNYCVSQFFAAVFAGGIAIMLGYSIFAAASQMLFPDISQMTEFAAEVLQGTTINIPLLIFKEFLFGAFWSIPAMFLTSVLNNKYLIMCIPFFLKYGLMQTYQKISQNAFSLDGVDENARRLANAVNPDGILWIYDETRLTVSLVFGISAAVMFAAFIIINRKRGDCGA